MTVNIRQLKPVLQILRSVYPPHCLTCNEIVGSENALCGQCWRETRFIDGLTCEKCGVPLPGEDADGEVLCDDCLSLARPWSAGRAAMLYQDNSRKIVLALKHGDRTELATAAAGWLLSAARPLIRRHTLVAPVPLHWFRLLRRRYNQSALLSAELARLGNIAHCPDLLLRNRATGFQRGRGLDDRFANVTGAMQVNPGRKQKLLGRHILLVDDVMTSGATLAAATEACLAAGAADVCTVVLARAAKEG